MIESILNLSQVFVRQKSAERASRSDGIFQKGRWGFRYDKSYINQWRTIAQEHRAVIEHNPDTFRQYLYAQSPAEQYAALELMSQPAFGIQRNGDTTAQLGVKDTGGLYAGLIQHHFVLPEDSEESEEQLTNRAAFTQNVWRLSVPSTALMFTVLHVTPDLLTRPYSEEVLPYMQRVIDKMSDDARNNLGESIHGQLEQLGIHTYREEAAVFAHSKLL